MKEFTIGFVKRAFFDIKDKGGNPYSKHLFTVAEKTKMYHNFYSGIMSDEIYIIALLHDIKEDLGYTNAQLKAMGYSDFVIETVDLLTKPNDIKYDDYILRIKENLHALRIKICDLEDNMDITRLEKITDSDIERLKKYHNAYKLLTK